MTVQENTLSFEEFEQLKQVQENNINTGQIKQILTDKI
jgi:hypothetical protein